MLTVNDYEASQSPDERLKAAEAQVCQFICPRLESLAEREVTVTHSIQHEPRARGVPPRGRNRLGPEVLKVWPVTGLVSVKVNGVDVTGDCLTSRWSVTYPLGFSALDEIEVKFKVGWPDASAIPSEIKQAVFKVFEHNESVPVGVVSERIDNHYIQYAQTSTPSGLPLDVQALLVGYQSP